MALKTFAVVASLLALAVGCDRSSHTAVSTKEVVLYTSIDEPVARPILDEFTKRTGIKVLIKTDAEASKTAGLVETIRAEKANPQADVFWNNETFHTINLAEEGLLAPYDSPSSKDVAPQFKDPKSRWSSDGLRLRMIAVSPKGERVTTIEQLADPALKSRVAMANPAFGTTSGHIAALFVLWGQPKAEQFLRDLKSNDVKLLGGNSEVVKQIALGNIDAGLTDNDDIADTQANGGKLTMLIPDQGADADGTLAIPTTLSLVKGAKHPESAKKLIDFLIDRQTEQKLLELKFSRWSVRGGSQGIKAMKIDYRKTVEIAAQAQKEATAILDGRDS